MQRFEYTTIDRILNAFQRNLGDEDITEENIVEWTGEALSELFRRGSLQECVLFALVENYNVEMPSGFKYISGILKNTKYNGYNPEAAVTCGEIIEIEESLPEPEEIIPAPEDEDCCLEKNCYGLEWGLGPKGLSLRQDLNHTLYRQPLPYLQLPWTFGYWYSSHMATERFSNHVELSNDRFFKTNVLKNQKSNFNFPRAFGDKYTLVGNNIRFNFEKGQVAIAYLRVPIDPETGYPLIPDENSYIQAIIYYIKWKLAEFYSWNGRQGFTAEADRAMNLWLKYVAQARVKTIKTRTTDEATMIRKAQSGSNI